MPQPMRGWARKTETLRLWPQPTYLVQCACWVAHDHWPTWVGKAGWGTHIQGLDSLENAHFDAPQRPGDR